MRKFPVDAPIARMLRALQAFSFRLVRRSNHIAMIRENADGTKTPLTIPNHPSVKSSTLCTILTQAGIPREEFLRVYEEG